jgi:hypothetical protein
MCVSVSLTWYNLFHYWEKLDHSKNDKTIATWAGVISYGRPTYVFLLYNLYNKLVRPQKLNLKNKNP